MSATSSSCPTSAKASPRPRSSSGTSNVGDTIAEDQVLVDVMTDKATVEMPSPVTGVVTSVGAAVGDILRSGHR